MLELGFFPLKQQEIGIIKRNVGKPGKAGPIQIYGTLTSQYIQEKFGNVDETGLTLETCFILLLHTLSKAVEQC